MKRRLAAVALVVLGCKKPAPPEKTVTAPSATPSASIVEPRRDVHPGVAVTLPNGALMNESAPYLVPDDAARPVTIILHALCADERWMCDWLQYGKLSPQWQLCPRGPTPCGNGGAQWTARGDDTLNIINVALVSARTRHPGRIGEGLVLVGMSQGAYAVSHAVHELALHPREDVKVRGIVLHGARVTLAASDVKELRVALAAGDDDAAAPSMRALATSLRAAGVDARYASFGKVGHFLPVDSAGTMSELIEWARAR